MCHALEFVETPIFTRQILEIATDDELALLQREIIQYPDKGDLIPQTGGLRKIRMATGNQGKSGCARVIYFLASEETVWLVMAYRKNEKETLSNAEKAGLRKLTQWLKSEG